MLQDVGHTHRFQFGFIKKNQVKSPSPESHTLNSFRIRQSGRTGIRGVTRVAGALGVRPGRAVDQQAVHLVHSACF